MTTDLTEAGESALPEPEAVEISADEWAKLKLCGAQIVTITKDEYIGLLKANLERYRAMETARSPHAKYSPETVAKIHQLRAQGFTIRRIAALVGCGRTTVECMLRGSPDVA